MAGSTSEGPFDAPADWDPLSGPPAEIIADLRLHEGYREALKQFYHSIAAESHVRNLDFLASLRQQSIYQFSEFFYLVRGFGLNDVTKLEQFVVLHNKHMTALLADRERLRLLGITPGRVQRAIFDQASLKKLVINFQYSDQGFDQSDLARLLVEIMSPETCRKTVVLLSQAGFLIRTPGVYNAVLVRSTGLMERNFARHLRFFRRFLEKGST